MVRHRSLYSNLISILYHQLGEIPADFFVDIVSQNNFLTSTLQVSSLLADTVWVRVQARMCENPFGRVTFLLQFPNLGLFPGSLFYSVLSSLMPETLSLYHHLPAWLQECHAVGYLLFE